MSFSTAYFLFAFLPPAIAFYHIFAWAERWSATIRRLRIKEPFLIFASVVFYGYGDPKNIRWLLGFIVLTWLIGFILKLTGPKLSVLVLGLGLIGLFSFLFYYKYFAFLADAASPFWRIEYDFSAVIAPAGISFITFSAVSYLNDSYRLRQYDNSLIDLSLYLTFFPKILSGPIVLWRDFAPQVDERTISSELLITGINKIVIGLAKKIILADTFGLAVANIQGNLATGIDIATAWGCAFLYMLQIYYDFAGYSSIAIGLASLFGFQISNNFEFPYVSVSITEFWRRWHISLGTWFREYLYIPLGGNRKGRARTYVNLGIVFVTTGLWHGAGPAYLAWGMLHGAMMILERLVKDRPFYRRIPRLIKWAFTMFIVMMGWLVFQFNSFSRSVDFARIMFGYSSFDTIFASFWFFFPPKVVFLSLVGVFGATFLSTAPCMKLYEKFRMSKGYFVAGEVLIALLFVLCILFMVNSTFSPFIYFQY